MHRTRYHRAKASRARAGGCRKQVPDPGRTSRGDQLYRRTRYQWPMALHQPAGGGHHGLLAGRMLTNSRDWIRHIPQEDHAVIEAAEEASLRGERFQAEYRIVRRDGSVIWVSDTAVVVSGSYSHPVMEGIIVDITERKLLENQLQQSRRMEAVGRLAGGIAHDFNNLLTIIKGYAELAVQRVGMQPELRADVQQIENAAERASTLIRQ